MARWSTVAVTLSAGQASGANPVLGALNGPSGGRMLCAIQSRSAAIVELFFDTAPVAGSGVPLAIGGYLDMSGGDVIPFNGDLFVLGATAGEKIVLILA